MSISHLQARDQWLREEGSVAQGHMAFGGWELGAGSATWLTYHMRAASECGDS